jgi:hypothetical protein
MLIADYEKSFAGKGVKQQSGLEVIKILLPVKNAEAAVVVAGWGLLLSLWVLG